MEQIEITLTIILCIAFLGIEFYFFRSKKENKLWLRFNVLFITFITFGGVLIVFIYIMNMANLMLVFWFNLIILFYIAISEFFLNRQAKFEINPNKKNRYSIVFALILVLAIFLLHGYLSQIYSGALFETADWFSSTFLAMLQDPSIEALVGLMTIGALTVLIGKARGASSYMVSGYFLIIGLPIFSVFQTFFTDIEEIQYKASEIYAVFRSEALTLIIYVFIQIIFYTLLSSVALTFLSMINPMRIEDDD